MQTFVLYGIKTWSQLLLSDTGRDEQLIALHHILQLTQITHVVDLPAKLKTTARE